MKSKVKLLSILLALIVLASCGQKEQLSASVEAPKPTAAATATPAPPPTPTATPAPTPVAPDDIPLQETPDSTCFSYVGYDPDTETLVVKFRRNSGYSKYCYYGISEELWEEFINSDSLGGFYNDEIKGQYSGDRLS